MRSWGSASTLCGLGIGRFMKRTLLGLLMTCAAAAQTPPKLAPKKTAAHRPNELTLAGLRPGKDTAARAVQFYKQPGKTEKGQDSQMVWGARCQRQTLSLDLDAAKKIQVVRTVEVARPDGACVALSPGPWKTGLGLRVGDAAEKVARLYGEPDSRSPSTKGGQPLELWYYAFDWAGVDVPQVMEVLCTQENDGKPGHVVEITLAAPSL